MSTLLTEDDVPATSLIEEMDDEEGRLSDSSPPIVLPPMRPSASETAPASTPHSRSRVLRRLLAMADAYYQGGSLRQAIELYFGLVRDHAGTPQALQAEERLLEVARAYEHAGELRQARGIYEQLL
jgi:hypothetical protein